MNIFIQIFTEKFKMKKPGCENMQKYSDLIKSGVFKWEIHNQDSVQVDVYGNDMAVANGAMDT